MLGDPINVAYPPNLRAEPADYSAVATLSGTSGLQVDITSNGFDGAEAGVIETWHCIPPYQQGGVVSASLIFVSPVSFTGVTDGQGAQVTFIDVNVDARAWVSV